MDATGSDAESERGSRTTGVRVVGLILVAALTVLVVAGCTVTRSGGGSAPTHPVSAAVATAVPFVWPLTATAGTIVCPGRGALVIEVDGRPYALNAAAKSAGFVNIDAVWADDPAVSGAKVDLQGLTDYASAACGY
jgi:hypothetical protein